MAELVGASLLGRHIRSEHVGASLTHLLSLALPGYVIFHHSHAFGTPLYLALATLFMPSNAPAAQTPESLYIEDRHLKAIPISFFLGYVVPIILMALPAPQVVSHRFKHTATGWYQQWHLIIAVIHYSIVWLSNVLHPDGIRRQDGPQKDSVQTLNLLRAVYGLAFALAVIPYYTTMVLSLSSILAPGLFDSQRVGSLHPKQLFIPTLPRNGLKIKDLKQGFKWLIQWDFVLGTVACTVWALAMRRNALEVQKPGDGSLYGTSQNAIAYFLVGGPVAIPIGFMWERDLLVFGGQQ